MKRILLVVGSVGPLPGLYLLYQMSRFVITDIDGLAGHGGARWAVLVILTFVGVMLTGAVIANEADKAAEAEEGTA